MNDLQNILNESSKHENYDTLACDIEIYIAKQYIFNIISINKDCVRIFPKDGSHYIELSSNNGIEEKLYAVYKRIYDHGLHHYISAIHFYGGNISFKVKEMYNQKETENIFNEILKNNIRVCGDNLTYDFIYD